MSNGAVTVAPAQRPTAPNDPAPAITAYAEQLAAQAPPLHRTQADRLASLWQAEAVYTHQEAAA